MDTSKEYIEMCDKSRELHKKRREDGDFVVTIIGVVCVVDDYKDETFFGSLWLPRQDQLQEMIDRLAWGVEYVHDRDGMFFGFYKHSFADRNLVEARYSFDGYDTLEKAYLGMVMKVKYNKVWNGKEWQIST
jgi:hypothetical protein